MSIYVKLTTCCELHKPIIRKFKSVIDLFSKYAWVIPLKDKKRVTIINSFQSILND